MKKIIIALAFVFSTWAAHADELDYERFQIENAGQALAIGRLCKSERSLMQAGKFKANAASEGQMTRYEINIATEEVAKKFAVEMKGRPEFLADWCESDNALYSPDDENDPDGL